MPEKHYFEQFDYAEKYLLPYLQKFIPELYKMRVLEIGCAEAGLMEALHNRGADCVGIELSPERAELAKEKNPEFNIVVGDISDRNLPEKIEGQFDLIIMREVIEHVPDKENAFINLKKLVKKDGYLFISFPPKYSPFAGHQQIGKSFLKLVPYLHLLPRFILNPVTKALNEKSGFVDEIKLHYSTGMGILKFRKLCRINNFTPLETEVYLFRPIYKMRFGLPTVRSVNIPLVREFAVLGYETLLISK
jgi:2-polyprenyl-3-methyl-5-hydroxy-6-metoxy-1,4-benzoquinol methylase